MQGLLVAWSQTLTPLVRLQQKTVLRSLIVTVQQHTGFVKHKHMDCGQNFTDSNDKHLMQHTVHVEGTVQ